VNRPRWHLNGGRIEAEGAYTSQARVIAVVGTVNEQTPEDTRNARLITAAPRLLVALRDLVFEHEHCGGCPDSSPAWIAAGVALRAALDGER